MTPGRPTKYKKEYVEQAEKLYRLGATDEEVADFFGVDRVTLYRWRNQHPDFCNTQKIGKESADDRVELSLYQRALGYAHESEEVKVIDGQVVKVPTVKQYPPDTTAAIFWLKNRRGWRDRQEHTHEVLDLNKIMTELDGEE